MKKIIWLIVVAAVGGYGLLLTRPGLYYGKSLEYKNFTLRSRGALPEGTEAVLDRVYEKLLVSELFSPDKKFDLYLPGGRSEFLIFTPLQYGDYARVNPYNGAIFIAAADFAADRARTVPGSAEYQMLSAEITKAAARELVRRSVKPLQYLTMSDWKLLGYSELLSGGSGTFTLADSCSGKDETPGLLAYKYSLAIDLAMREEGISFADLLGKDYSYENVAMRLKKMNCGG